MTEKRKRLAIIDDHTLVLDGLSTWFAANAPDFDLVISVSVWSELIRHPAFPPDVVLMDFQLVEPLTIESRVGLCKAAGAAVVVMSAVTSTAEIGRILNAGASRFVPKSQPAAELLAAVRAAVAPPPAWEYTPAWGSKPASGTQGEVPAGLAGVNAGPQSQIQLPSGLQSPAGLPPSQPTVPRRPRFSDKDIAILNLYANGHNPVEVAMMQNIRAGAVRKALERMRAAYEKVGRPADDRETLIRRAAEDGFLS
ncbi:DNA-binding response regulator [Subtercola frigoramans]|uniref:DNA-binding NarL/FixJ family response regulator n=1 Tax=Subtercola frigoramans TaxID=120298 RepID=A0ABS2L8L9_9MICO|nr:response regulator [Subtercola frigoramans]MBM7473445.1 DNA-binding NarL/FixJ family response regulator [Subtercola frigoramans]